jgi:hypothetical protein
MSLVFGGQGFGCGAAGGEVVISSVPCCPWVKRYPRFCLSSNRTKFSRVPFRTETQRLLLNGCAQDLFSVENIATHTNAPLRTSRKYISRKTHANRGILLFRQFIYSRISTRVWAVGLATRCCNQLGQHCDRPRLSVFRRFECFCGFMGPQRPCIRSGPPSRSAFDPPKFIRRGFLHFCSISKTNVLRVCTMRKDSNSRSGGV